MAEHKNSVYRKISGDIAAKIKSGEYAKGSMLEPERKLMEIYGTQRTTIRRALDILVDDGLIEKKSGLGTFVADGKSVPVSKNSSGVKATKSEVKKQVRKSLPGSVELKKCFLGAAKTVFQKLDEAGHKKIIYIGRNDAVVRAVCGEMAARGIYDKELTAIAEGRYDADIMFDKVWSGIRSGKPTAVVADTAEDGQKIMRMAERNRISVPNELSVVCVETTIASDIAGCIFDENKKVKELVCAFTYTADKDIPEISVAVKPEYIEGKTLAEAQKDRVGSGRMSDYLL